MLKVLFVCTGNICRSPAAEGALRNIADARGMGARLLVDSAGTHGYHVGEPPDPRMIEAARRRGFDLSGQRARRVARKDFETFDLIVAMDRDHHAIMLRLCPGERAHKLRLFMEYAPEFGIMDVPDPYYGEDADFERVLDMAERGAKAILASLEDKIR